MFGFVELFCQVREADFGVCKFEKFDVLHVDDWFYFENGIGLLIWVVWEKLLDFWVVSENLEYEELSKLV